MRVVSLGQSQESSTLVELRGTRVLLDAGLSLAASARLVQRVVEDGCDEESKPKSKSNNHRRPHTTGRGEFLISAPAYRTAVFEATDCGAIDAVLVTSAAGLLGLPYLVQAAAEAVGGQRGVSAGDPRAGGVMPLPTGSATKGSAPSPAPSHSSSLPPFLDPPFEVFATDLAVDMALAWIAELAASSSAAADAAADEAGDEEEDDEEEDERRRRSGGRCCSSSSCASSPRPLAGLPASALAALTAAARRDILGPAAEGGGDAISALEAWRRAYPAALAAALLSGDTSSSGGGSGGGGGAREKSGRKQQERENENGKVKGQVVTRVAYGERVRLRGGALCAVATAAGGSSPGGAVWTLVDSVAEGAASLAACSGRVGAGVGGERGGGEAEETGVARVVCVGAVGAAAAASGSSFSSSPSSSSAAAPLNVAALKGAHVLVLAPPGDPPPRPSRPLLKSENAAVVAPPFSSSSSSSSPFAAAAAAAVSAVEKGGNALLPVSVGDGRALELIECVLAALYARGGQGMLTRVPCVLAAPGARRAAAAACSSAEWLCAARSALVLSGRAPYFAGGAAASAAASVVGGGGGGGGGGGSEQQGAGGPLRSGGNNGGGLFVAESLSEARKRHGWREPCVAFVPTSSLFNSSGGGGGGGGGGGDGAALLRAWGGDPRSAVVFTCSSSSPLPSGARLSQLVSRAHPGIRARIVDVGIEEAEASAKNGAAASASPPSASAASALCSLVAAVSPGVVVVPRAWERAMLRESSDATTTPPLGKACARVEALDPLVPLELAESGGEEDGDDESGEHGAAALPRALSRAGVTSELASAASKLEAKSRYSSRVLLALATVRDGEVELDAPPGAAGGAALAAALVVGSKGLRRKKRRSNATEEKEGKEDAAAAPPPPSAPRPSSTLDALLCELGAPAVEAG